MVVSFERTLTYRELLALYADVAGALLDLGRPASLSRTSFTRGFDRGNAANDDWPGEARYDGDGVVVLVEVECVDDNSQRGWRYRSRFRCTSPGAPALWSESTSTNPEALAMTINFDDCDLATFDRVRALIAMHANGARDRTDVWFCAKHNAQCAEKIGRFDDAATFQAREQPQ